MLQIKGGTKERPIGGHEGFCIAAVRYYNYSPNIDCGLIILCLQIWDNKTNNNYLCHGCRPLNQFCHHKAQGSYVLKHSMKNKVGETSYVHGKTFLED